MGTIQVQVDQEFRSYFGQFNHLQRNLLELFILISWEKQNGKCEDLLPADLNINYEALFHPSTRSWKVMISAILRFRRGARDRSLASRHSTSLLKNFGRRIVPHGSRWVHKYLVDFIHMSIVFGRSLLCMSWRCDFDTSTWALNRINQAYRDFESFWG